MSDTTERLPGGGAPPGRVIPTPPIHPPVFPAPVTFDISVPSMTVKNPRALFTDTDFATLPAATLAPDGTQIAKYGPLSRSLGGLGKGQTIDPFMSPTAIDVPDGGSVAFTFVVVNHGAWASDISAGLNALDTVGAAVIGAVIQGSIAGSKAGSPSNVTIYEAKSRGCCRPWGPRGPEPHFCGL